MSFDNTAHGGDMEQQIKVYLHEGTCITAKMMRQAVGESPRAYDTRLLPPPHPLAAASNYYRPAYDLEFVVRDKYPEDQRKIFLGNGPSCFRTIIVFKHFKEAAFQRSKE